MIVEVLAWGAVISAGGFVVTAADGSVEWVSFRIDIEGKAAWTTTGRTCVAAGRVGVFLKGVVM